MTTKSLLKRATKGGKAVYWEKSGYDEQGQQTWGDPIEIMVRWTDRQVEMVEPNGDKWVSKAIVLLHPDDPELVLNGVLWQGALADLTDAEHPFANKNASEIRRLDHIPGDIPQSWVMRRAIL